ncbi:MAG: transcriptional repressor [Chloroflexi bacterium]|nr:transcriptional repressor [Chloroflexota bacterium]
MKHRGRLDRMQFDVHQLSLMERLGELRLTRQRRAVLDAVVSSGEHLTAAAVYDRVRRRLPKIGYGTVYAALHYLVQAGLIAGVRRADGVTAFDRRTERHDHVTCRGCGRLADVEAHMFPAYRPIAAATGFLIEGHAIEFWGLCPNCQALQQGDLERLS